jgi:hypothetical protein
MDKPNDSSDFGSGEEMKCRCSLVTVDREQEQRPIQRIAIMDGPPVLVLFAESVNLECYCFTTKKNNN